MIPDCHPLPIEHAEVTFDVQAMAILVKVKVRTIYRTGVEVEAMHGASVAGCGRRRHRRPQSHRVS